MDNHNKIERYLKFLASEIKDQEAASRCRVGALLVYKNMPIALGRNSMKSHPIMTQFGRTENHIFLHAEISAILKAAKELSPNEINRSTLYVCRTLANGKSSLAKPCPGCQKAIKEFGIENVIWTTENGYSTSFKEPLNDTNEIYEYNKNLRKNICG